MINIIKWFSATDVSIYYILIAYGSSSLVTSPNNGLMRFPNFSSRYKRAKSPRNILHVFNAVIITDSFACRGSYPPLEQKVLKGLIVTKVKFFICFL